MDNTTSVAGTEVKVSTSAPLLLGKIGKGYWPKQDLMDLVNTVSKKKYTLTWYDFIKIRRMPNGSVRNTYIEIINVAVDTQLFTPKAIEYNRIHVSELGVIVIPKGSFLSTVDALNAINGFCQTSILAEDIVNAALPDADGSGNVTVSLVFNESSIQYYSGDIVAVDTQSGSVSKADVGLSLADNTPDSQKPVSSAQALAITQATAAVLAAAKQFTLDKIVELQTPGGFEDGVIVGGDNMQNGSVIDGQNF